MEEGFSLFRPAGPCKLFKCSLYVPDVLYSTLFNQSYARSRGARHGAPPPPVTRCGVKGLISLSLPRDGVVVANGEMSYDLNGLETEDGGWALWRASWWRMVDAW
jgi:hypothetical protein